MNPPAADLPPTPPRQPDPLWEATQMDGLPVTEQATKAIGHVLTLICENPHVGYYLGIGTESFALLTEAAARLSGATVRDVRECFCPQAPEEPGAADKERLEWLRERLLEMPSYYRDLIGLRSNWTDFREVIDAARGNLTRNRLNP